MPGFLHELSDLLVMLALICVPVASGAVFIPLGRALAERVRQRRTLSFDAESRLMHRLDGLEQLIASIAAEVQKQCEYQRALELRLRTFKLPDAREGDAQGRVITPH